MGLNFLTCTIINENVDNDSNGKVLFEGADGVLRIKRDFTFEKRYVQALRKQAGNDPVPCKATINFGTLDEGTYRLDVYIQYEGAEPFYGANPMHIQKGIPFWVEFTKKGEGAIAEKIAKQIKKDNLFLIDKDVINVSVSGDVMTLTGAGEYARFGKITISEISTMDEEVVAEIGNGITVTEKGKNGFGTYSHLIKDLRLPTAANTQWSHIRQAETPVVGALYNQYIIEYCAPALNDGTSFVGHRGNNWTTHVFWVKSDVVPAWEAAIAAIDPDGGSLEASNVAASIEDVTASIENRLSELEKA